MPKRMELPITEETLAAYVDNLLEPRRRADVEAYLARHPEEAARVQAYMNQNRRLHDVYDWHLVKPVPDSLRNLASQLGHRVVRRHRFRQAMALAASIAVLGVAIGVAGLGYERFVKSSPSEALFALFDGDTADKPQTEDQTSVQQASLESGGATDEQATKKEAVKPAFNAPDFKAFGFELISTRLLRGSAEEKAAMHLTYESKEGAQVSLYFSPSEGDQKTRLTLQQQGPISVLFWHSAGRFYNMIGEVDRDTLLGMGKAVDSEWVGGPSSDDAATDGPPEPTGGGEEDEQGDAAPAQQKASETDEKASIEGSVQTG